jgi:thymidylate kinase
MTGDPASGERSANSGRQREFPPQIVAVEGLDGTGKSTVADAIVALTDGVNITKVAAEQMGSSSRDTVCMSDSAEARFHYWSCMNYLVGDLAKDTVASGRVAVIDSYFFRTIVTHYVLGVRTRMGPFFEKAVRPDRAVLLTVPEPIRASRLRARKVTGILPEWHRRIDDRWRQVLALYRIFRLMEVDSTVSPYGVALTTLHSTDAERFRFDDSSTGCLDVPVDLVADMRCQ